MTPNSTSHTVVSAADCQRSDFVLEENIGH
jgi:hypothetical protein